MSYSTAISYRPPSLVLSRLSPESIGVGGRQTTTNASASAAWGTNNLGIIIPFYLTATTTYLNAWIYNGTTASGNVDVGIYDEAYALKVSTGAIAQSGTSAVQALAMTDVTLPPGQYYLALSCSSSTSTTFGQATVAGRAAAFGYAQMASAHPLPSTFVPALYAQTLNPDFGVTQRSFV